MTDKDVIVRTYGAAKKMSELAFLKDFWVVGSMLYSVITLEDYHNAGRNTQCGKS